MKQLLKAGVLALGIHAILLGINFKWPGSIFLNRPKPLALNMTLTSISVKTTPKLTPQQPKPVIEKPTIVNQKKKKPKYKGIVKSPPKKKFQIPVQSKEKEVLKTNSEKTAEKIVSNSDSEKIALQTPFKTSKQADTFQSPPKIVHEARPIYRSNPSPNYPRIARIRGYQGDVLLDVLVKDDGKVDDVKVFRSSGYPVLDRAAESSVKNWLFEPGMIGDEKVDMWVRVPIRFELK